MVGEKGGKGKGRHTGVISLEAQDDVAVGIEDKCIAPHGDGGKGGGCDVGVLEETCLFL